MTETHQLKKILGVSFGVAVTIGGMIGLGILRTPGAVAAELSSVWLILLVWTVGGIYALLGVFSAAELGVSIPRTGGWYSFARRAFGEYAGFAAGWMDWIAYPATIAIAAITTAQYLALLFPGLTNYVSLTAIAIVLAVTFVNCLGLRSGSRFQEILSFLKAFVFLAVIVAAFVFTGEAESSTQAAESVRPAIPLATALIIALQAVIYTYDGWYSAIYFSEECTDTSSIPRSMVIAVIFVTIIYVLFNAALLYSLPLSQLASSTLPVADVANKIFGIYGDRVITVVALVTLLSILNANLLTGPRILFALSRDGLFTKSAGKVNEGGTPANALFITVAVSIPVILTGSFETILAVTAFLFIALYVSGFLAVIVLRYREADLARPYKAFGYPWTTGIVLLGSFAFLIGAIVTDTLNALYAIGLMILSLPFYYLVKRTRKPAVESLP
ncbi:MAG: amino acid permease [Pyrinomonadaceae bacterium]